MSQTIINEQAQLINGLKELVQKLTAQLTAASTATDLLENALIQLDANKEGYIQKCHDRILQLEERQFSAVYHLNLEPNYEHALISVRAKHVYIQYTNSMAYFNSHNPESTIRTLNIQEYHLLKFIYEKELENAAT